MRIFFSLVPVLPVVSMLAVVALFALSVPVVAGAQTLTVAETETLVRASYFEGMPEDVAARIGPAGAERLVEMLFDPEEVQSHAQILLALGLCGSSPNAMAAILRWSAPLSGVATLPGVAPLTGEIDRDTFTAWQALPFALGHLARFDRRALVYLEAMMNDKAPSWTFRHHEGARLVDLERRSAATSLALTGLPEARRALDRVGLNASDPRFEEFLQNARTLHAERAREMAR